MGNNIVILNHMDIHISGSNSTVKIGNNNMINSVSILLGEYKSKVIIGNDCLFAGGICLLSTDYHSIVDKETYECLNYQRDGIVINNHVWIGSGVTILKNSNIGADSIVSMSAVVSGKFPANSVLGGVPARQLKEGVCWNKETPLDMDSFRQVENFDVCINQSSLHRFFIDTDKNTPFVNERYFSGWAFVEGKDSFESNIYFEITLKQGKRYTFQAHSLVRQSVAQVFGDDKYSNCGFSFVIPKEIPLVQIKGIKIINTCKDEVYRSKLNSM